MEACGGPEEGGALLGERVPRAHGGVEELLRQSGDVSASGMSHMSRVQTSPSMPSGTTMTLFVSSASAPHENTSGRGSRHPPRPRGAGQRVGSSFFSASSLPPRSAPVYNILRRRALLTRRIAPSTFVRDAPATAAGSAKFQPYRRFLRL